MKNRKALQSLSYGVYLLTTESQGSYYGCTVNSVIQITSDPMCVAVSIHHDNLTHDKVMQSGTFAAAILSTDVNPSLIGKFGYASSRNTDKFVDVSYMVKNGMPIPDEAMAWITCRVAQKMDAGTHTVFLGEVLDCDLVREDAIPMTYAYYHTVIKGKSPKNAPTYVSSN